MALRQPLAGHAEALRRDSAPDDGRLFSERLPSVGGVPGAGAVFADGAVGVGPEGVVVGVAAGVVVGVGCGVVIGTAGAVVAEPPPEPGFDGAVVTGGEAGLVTGVVTGVVAGVVGGEVVAVEPPPPPPPPDVGAAKV